MSNQTEINSLKEEINRNFTEQKALMKEFAQKEAKGIFDGELKEKIERFNDSITAFDAKLAKAEDVLAKMERRNEVGDVLSQKQELKDAWISLLRKGDPKQLSAKHQEILAKSLNSFSDTAGGYLVVPYFDTEITKRLYEMSAMRQYANIKNISTDQYEKPQNPDLAGAYWHDRDHDWTETSTPTFAKLIIRVHKLVAAPKVSTDLIDDAAVDLEAELLDMIQTAFNIAEETAFFVGDGLGQPRGILTYPAGTGWGQIEQVPGGDASAITADGLTNLVYSLKGGYAANARFMMANGTLAKIRMLVDGNGNALWTPQFGSEPATIMGYPVVRAPDMPAVESNALPVAFGDFRRAYIIVDRQGTRILRNIYTDGPFVKYVVTKRVGGAVDNYEAVKLLKVSAS